MTNLHPPLLRLVGLLLVSFPRLSNPMPLLTLSSFSFPSKAAPPPPEKEVAAAAVVVHRLGRLHRQILPDSIISSTHITFFHNLKTSASRSNLSKTQFSTTTNNNNNNRHAVDLRRSFSPTSHHSSTHPHQSGRSRTNDFSIQAPVTDRTCRHYHSTQCSAKTLFSHRGDPFSPTTSTRLPS